MWDVTFLANGIPRPTAARRDSNVREKTFASARTQDREGAFAVDLNVRGDLAAFFGASVLANRSHRVLRAGDDRPTDAAVLNILIAIAGRQGG
jgi:hypothetical protein